MGNKMGKRRNEQTSRELLINSLLTKMLFVIVVLQSCNIAQEEKDSLPLWESKMGDTSSTYIIYKYENNKVIKETTSYVYYEDGEKKVSIFTKLYSYNSNGKLVMENSICDLDLPTERIIGDTYYSYNEKGEMIRKSVTNLHGDTILIETYSLSTKGDVELLKKVRMGKGLFSAGPEISETYDTTFYLEEIIKKDTIVKVKYNYIIKNNQKELLSSNFFHHDSLNREIEKYNINNNGDTLLKTKITYKNNKIDKKYYYQENKLNSIMLFDENGCVKKGITYSNAKTDTAYYICDENCKLLGMKMPPRK